MHLGTHKVTDYRLLRPSMFLEEDGERIAFVSHLTSVKIGVSTIDFPTPNTITLLLSKSWKEYERAEKIYNKVLLPHSKNPKRHSLNNMDLRRIFDYLEHIQTSIISIYTAVESLTNAMIPEDFTMNKINYKGVTEIWTKQTIERWLSTEEKLNKVIPDILKIGKPSEESFWPVYMELKSIRDSIVHQKYSKSNPGNVNDTFLEKLFEHKIFSIVMSGFSVLKYITSNGGASRFLPIFETEIEISIDGTFRQSDLPSQEK